MAIVHWEVDAKQMKTAIYGVDEYGEFSKEPWATLRYKRQNRQVKKKAAAKTK